MFGLRKVKNIKQIRYSRTEKMTTIKKKQTPREARGKNCFAAHISLRSADLGKTKRVSARSAGKKYAVCSPRAEKTPKPTKKQKSGRRLRAKRQKKMCFLLSPSRCCPKNANFPALAGLSRFRDLKQINKAKNRRPGNPFYRQEGGGMFY